jgi:hypothetical protein
MRRVRKSLVRENGIVKLTLVEREQAKRSGMVKASNDSSASRDTAVCSASKISTISSRLFASMFEYYLGLPTTKLRG